MTIRTRKISDIEFKRLQQMQRLLHERGYDLSFIEISELINEFLVNKSIEFLDLAVEKLTRQSIVDKDEALESLLYDEVILPSDSPQSDSVEEHDITM